MKVLKNIDRRKKEIISFTQELVRINSVNGNETEVCKLIKKNLLEYGIKSKLVGKDKKRLNLLAEIKGKKSTKSLMINGHTDTVAFGDISKWKYDPLSGKLVGDRIYGRGSYDMKCGLAAAVFAIIALKESEIELGGNVILALTADEESGKHTGIRYLIKMGIKPTACIVAEPMSKKSIRIGSRGIYRFEITTKGKTAHTGLRKYEGINAVTKMSKILLALEKLKPKYTKHKMFPPPKITPGTKIEGGIAINIVPDSCKALVDCRLSYGQTKKSILSDINKELKKVRKDDKASKFKIRELAYVPPAIIDRKEKIVELSCKVTKKVLGFKPSLRTTGGVTDGTLLSNVGIPTVVLGPEGNNAHSENEYVLTKSIINASKIFVLTAVDFLGVNK